MSLCTYDIRSLLLGGCFFRNFASSCLFDRLEESTYVQVPDERCWKEDYRYRNCQGYNYRSFHFSSPNKTFCRFFLVYCLVVVGSVTLRARASLTVCTMPPIFKYQTNAAGKRITGTAIASATITCHSILVLLSCLSFSFQHYRNIDKSS